MVANATFGRAFVGIVAVVQDVLLDVAEDRLGWVIVRTPFGHAGPVQPQLPHRPPRHPRLDGIEGPMDTALVDLVEQEQVEPPPGLLIPPQYQAFGPCVTSAAIRLDRDRLHIEEGQDGSAWAVVPPRAQPVQDQMPIGIGAEELATDAAKCGSPFFSTRRRCSRLIVGTMRWRMRYARNLAKLQRPNGSPRVVGAWSARRQMAAICCFDKRGGAPSLRGRLSADRPCRANSRRSVETVLRWTWRSWAIDETEPSAA